jgi:hypothetical protein
VITIFTPERLGLFLDGSVMTELVHIKGEEKAPRIGALNLNPGPM